MLANTVIARESRASRALVCALCVLGTSLSTTAARADQPSGPNDPVKARALFSEARKLVEQGNYEQACGKFEESLRLNVGLGTQFNLADCWEHVGRTASARALFLGVAASARAASQTDREQVAQARAEALEPRLVRLLIDVRATDKDLAVRRNQEPLDRWNWGNAIPVDPGAYLIEATAPGKKPWSARVTIPETATQTITLTIPPLEDAAAQCEAPAAAAQAQPAVAEKRPPLVAAVPPPSLPENDPRSARRTGYALAVGGFGVVAATAGVILGLEYKSKNDDAKAICPSGAGCSNADVDSHSQLVSDAKTFRTWSFIGFGVGGAALIGAAALYFAPASSTSSSNASTTTAWRASPFVTADGTWGVAAAGRF